MKRILLFILVLVISYIQAADRDLAISKWYIPQSAGSLSNNELVRFEIENLGTQEETGFIVAYSLNGGQTFVEETFSTIIPIGAKRPHTFVTKGDFSIDGATYEVITKVMLVGDENTSNDQQIFYIQNKIMGDMCDEPFLMNLGYASKY